MLNVKFTTNIFFIFLPVKLWKYPMDDKTFKLNRKLFYCQTALLVANNWNFSWSTNNTSL